MEKPIPCVAALGSAGFNLCQGPPNYDTVSAFTEEDKTQCKTILFSPGGTYFAWLETRRVRIALCQTWKIIHDIVRPNVSFIKFSPLENYLMTWNQLSVTNPNAARQTNMIFWNTKTGELVKGFFQKRYDWEPEWSSDQKLCGMLIKNDILFYDNENFEKPAHKFNSAKVQSFSISPGKPPFHVICFIPGKSGQPAVVKLFQYPKLDVTIATKTFFQADKITVFWNKIGDSALVMTSTEVDKTGASYYGKQTLHFISIKGDTSVIPLSVIHAVAWSPLTNEFCCVYGSAPMKATLFNKKCEPIFEFGTILCNSIYFNPFGNIMLLGGFGNLQGNIEIWDMINKQSLGKTVACNTTLLQWSPDGEHFMTATTAPRLRMDNGFKIWHYSGTLLYERPWNVQEVLCEVQWQTFKENTFTPKPISYKSVEGIAPSQPQASKKLYVPVFARERQRKLNLQNNEDSSERQPSKATIKLKKKKEAKKAKKELEAQSTNSTNVNGQSNSTPKVPSTPSINVDLTDDPEKNKKIKKIKSKLDQITKLKEQQFSGKQLEMNQLEKIKKEAELTKELQELIL